MAGYVGRLEAGEQLDATPYLKGPWRSFERRTIAGDSAEILTASDAEYAVIIMSGAGTFEVASTQRPYTPGSTFTVGYRAALTLEASEETEFFITTLNVDP